MKTKRCYLYTRVSTAIQVDGFSLDAQRDKLHKYAEFQDMVIAGEYCDEGKSGKNIQGRPEFQRMLADIEAGKDNVDFVLVFKLSRFDRNAADVLSSLQRMQDFGVNLICVEDGIDSSKDAGKLMISVLSAVAEIERENIRTQTMAGREQKAREGKWNGGFAPYGYKLENGELLIAEDEAEVIRVIYDKFIHACMGSSKIAEYLNSHYQKKKRQNNTLDLFSANFVRKVLENPVYCGKIAYGRRATEKIPGTRNEYHIVHQDEFPVYEGKHEAIISEEDWELARQRREETGKPWEKIYNLERENLLSGILRCPVCGAGMYGNVNRKRNKQGEFYKDYYYYTCKHRLSVDGHRCDFKRQFSQEKINSAVEEIIYCLVNNPRFEAAIREKIGQRIDTHELKEELAELQQQLRQKNGAKDKLGDLMDRLDVTDPHYERKYADMESRLDRLYDEIAGLEESIAVLQTRLDNLLQEKFNVDQVYQFLLYFDKLYAHFTDSEKKKFLSSFIERIEIYPEEQPDGRLIRSIRFKFPVWFGEGYTSDLSWDNETTVSTCAQRGNMSTASAWASS